ncbi:interferon-inducible GTPase 5-like [Scyliorhinus canicula]|uniref:interferon-inducible GTPase 5-like n=1 Tax=Scyliorhinus canicula TaxID=7830 RepID=UPI0018F75DAB|nr:interferon-inducible GTPase 5-like [Scyliorhinus canicula]
MDQIRYYTHYSATDVKDLVAAYQHGGMANLQGEMEKKANTFKNVSLNVAIMGGSGVGKSTLINALRGLDVNHADAAPTGVVETTMKLTPYPHPTLPNVTYWDFPGVASINFPVKQSLKQTNFSQYDFGLIVCAERFSEHDKLLATKMKEAGKSIFFVRSKIDQSIQNESRKHGYNKEKVLEGIREYCSKSLATIGIKDTPVFLISGEDMDNYDFNDLKSALDSILPEKKKDLFAMALPNTSIAVIKMKEERLKIFIHVIATVSAIGGAVPIPGLSFACDLAIILSSLLLMQQILGLDNASIQNLARTVGKPRASLLRNVKDSFVFGEISKDQVLMLLSRSSMALALTAAEPILDFIPIVGSIFGAASSFWVTHTMLKDALEEFVEAACTVLKNAHNLV